MRVEVVHDEVDCLRGGVPIGDPLEGARELLRGTVARGVGHVAPYLGLDDAEDVRSAASHVLVVLASDASGRRGSPWSSGIPEDDWPLIERDDRLGLVRRLCHGVEHVLHPRHVLLVQPGDAPHFFPATA